MKAQVISMDIMIAVIIVISLVSAMGVLLYQYTLYDKQDTELREIELRSEPALNVIMSTKGNPDNWETLSCSEIKSLGFMSQPAKLSGQKLKGFVDLDYNCSQRLLGISGYNFYFDARYDNGSLITIGGTSITKGYEPEPGSTAIFSTRSALIDDNYIGTITLGVWYE